MANRSTAFGVLVRRAPHLARLRLRKVLRASRGNICASARLLGVSRYTVIRAVIRFDQSQYLDEIRAKYASLEDEGLEDEGDLA